MESNSFLPRKEKISNIMSRISGCLWGMCISDAVSVPSDCYPDSKAIQNDYGMITKYLAPKELHPKLVLDLQEDGSPAPYNDVVGKTILHNKQKYWTTQTNYHPHIELKAGENTLNVEIARVLIRTLIQRSTLTRFFDIEAYQKTMLDFITKPNSHNDCYASVSLRKFLHNYEKKRSWAESKISEYENTATIADLVATIPAILAPVLDKIKSLNQSDALEEVEITSDVLEMACKNAMEVVEVMNDNPLLRNRAELFAVLLVQLVVGVSPEEALNSDAARALGCDVAEWATLQIDEVIGDQMLTSSDLDSALKTTLFLFTKFHKNFEQGILKNANAGGKTCGRGALLGALLGAVNGQPSYEDYWMRNLHKKDQIQKEIVTLLHIVWDKELPQGPELFRKFQLRPLLPKKIPIPTLTYKIEGVIWGLLCADSLAMPVHYYYDLERLKEDYGEITTYVDPQEKHYLDLLSVTESSKALLEKVIGPENLKRWGIKDNHVHLGLKAGANTLDAHIFRVALRTVIRRKRYLDNSFDPESFLQDYVEMVTKPGKSTDTYIASCHREFFSNYFLQKPIFECGCQPNETNDTASGFFTLPAIVFSVVIDELRSQQLPKGSELEISNEIIQKAIQKVLRHLSFLHRSERMRRYARLYTEIFLAVLFGLDLRKAIEQIASPQLGINFKGIYEKGDADNEVFTTVFKNSGFIEGSLPAGLYLAYKYANDFYQALKANANLGGDNVGRAIFVGALVGAQRAQNVKKEALLQGLIEKDAIIKEITELLAY